MIGERLRSLGIFHATTRGGECIDLCARPVERGNCYRAEIHAEVMGSGEGQGDPPLRAQTAFAIAAIAPREAEPAVLRRGAGVRLPPADCTLTPLGLRADWTFTAGKWPHRNDIILRLQGIEGTGGATNVIHWTVKLYAPFGKVKKQRSIPKRDRPLCGFPCKRGGRCRARVTVREDGSLANACRGHFPAQRDAERHYERADVEDVEEVQRPGLPVIAHARGV